jgi:hypothetical protein
MRQKALSPASVSVKVSNESMFVNKNNGGERENNIKNQKWIPACAGMTR